MEPPWGCRSPSCRGGHLPTTSTAAAAEPDDLAALAGPDLNHPSFRMAFPGDLEAAGLALLRQSVAQGFAEVFVDRAAASAALGGEVLPAPLGCVSKPKADGSWKHRLIQDLRMNAVNSAVALPERLVLPRPVDLGKDLAELIQKRTKGDGLKVGIIDFADAFMSIPLAPEERRFNCAVLPEPIELGRPPLHALEPAAGKMIVWRVLGFGGRPNPLIFGRVTAALMRTAQGILTCLTDAAACAGSRHGSPSDHPADYLDARARAHLYVDDAAVALAGDDQDIIESFDLLLLFFLVMGAPVAWSKVALHDGSAGPVRWIGVEFDVSPAGCARLRLPPEFLEELAEQVTAIARAGGRVSDGELHKMIGRAARVSFVVPAAAPFAAALRAALVDARATAGSHRRAAQRSSHAATRFATAASWFVALLRGRPLDGRTDLPLEMLIRPGGLPQLVAGSCDALVFDASVWGGGAVRFAGRQPVACLVMEWTPSLCEGLKVRSGESKFLPFFEALTALAAITVWCGPGRLQSAALVGDNLAALTTAVSFRGRGDLGRVCRELALRQARWGLHLAVGHLPSEINDWADSLSRRFAPCPPPLPQILEELPRETPPEMSSLFTIEPPTASSRSPSAH